VAPVVLAATSTCWSPFVPRRPGSTLDLVDLREELMTLFGRNVDLVEEKVIRNPYRRQSILRDKSVLYAT
jgi:predicted nucleotidyltransferase